MKRLKKLLKRNNTGELYMTEKKVSKETEQQIMQLQMLEQNLTNLTAQKQQFQSQLIEIDSALKELKDAKTSYKIVGNIMVSAKKEDLEKDLNQKKEIVDLRIKNFDKQEKVLKDKASNIQKQVMEKLK